MSQVGSVPAGVPTNVGQMTEIYSKWQKATQQGDAAALPRPSETAEQVAVSPAAKQKAIEDAEGGLDRAVSKLTPSEQSDVKRIQDQVGAEYADARKHGKPYDPQASYTFRVMQYASGLLSEAGDPKNTHGQEMAANGNLQAVGNVFHAGYQYFQARNLPTTGQ